MTKIEQEIQSIRSKLSDEEVSKVSSSLENIRLEEVNLIRANTNLESDLKSTTAEAIERKKLIRTELNPKIEDQDIKIDTLEKKILELEGGSNEVQTELTKLREFKANVIKSQKTQFVDRYNSLKEHPKFEKAVQVKNIIIPEKDDKGNVKWDDLKEEQVEHNVIAVNELDDLGFFAGDGQPPPDGSKATMTHIPKDFKDKVAAAKTPDEVVKLAEQEGLNI